MIMYYVELQRQTVLFHLILSSTIINNLVFNYCLAKKDSNNLKLHKCKGQKTNHLSRHWFWSLLLHYLNARKVLYSMNQNISSSIQLKTIEFY